MRVRLLTAFAAALLAAAAAACGHSAPSTQEQIGTLLQSSERAKQVDAARELAEPVDPTVARQVVRRAGPDPQARAGVAILRDRYLTIYRGAPVDRATRSAAVRALAEFDDPAAAKAVSGALMKDRAAATRRAAADALGRMPRSAPTVVSQLVAYREVHPRSGAEIDGALVAIGRPTVPVLLPVALDAQWAADVIADIGRPAVPLLRARLRSGNLRQKAMASMGLIAMRRTQPAVARAAMPTILSTMMAALATNDADPAIKVLARAGDPARQRLVALARKPYTELSSVEQKQASWTAHALATMVQVNPKAGAPLIAALRRRDLDFVADLHDFYIQLGRPGSEGVLIDALNAHGDTVMALSFLNSGNAKLDRGARAWAASRGYTVTSTPGQAAPRSWGSSRTAFD
jgi:HEAT repeats